MVTLRRQSGRVAGAPACVLAALVMAVLPLVAQCGAAAEITAPLEYQVKAAFLLNFTRFVEWPQPESASSPPFSICILGEDPFQGALEKTMEGETVNGR